jgi:hypothetical protein
LNWAQNANETGFEIYRSTVSGSAYQLIAVAPANAVTYTDNTLVANSTYFYIVRSVNGTGAAVKSNESSPNNGNKPPVIASLSNMFAKTGASVTEPFTVTDNAGDVVTVTLSKKPAFITLQHGSGINYSLVANPTVDDIGWSDITVLATDNKGMYSSQTISILVADKNTRSVYLNFGSAGKTAPAPWNNWLGIRAANNVISNLKDENNVTTTISVTTVTGWATTTNLGHITGNNGGVFPDAVLQSGIADNGTPRQIRISGLNKTKLYNLGFVGSQNEGMIATTSYSTGSQTAVLNARNNMQQTANLNSLVPDANGQILVTISRTGTSAYSYLNGMVIEEYAPSITLVNPINLYVEPVDRTSAMLTWCDRTNNESSSGGYELKRATDAAFTQGVATILLAGNTTSYKNTGLAANTKYWYRLRAKNGSSYSDYSNRVVTITPSFIVYVNFNTTVPNAGSPWNNLQASPLSVFTVNSLKNQSGVSTSISLKLEKVFNGEFTAGMNTGNNSGVAPDNALMSNYWLDNTQLSQFRVIGLNKTRRYRFGFFGSSGPAGWFKGDYTATYSINGKTVYLNSWQNTTKIVYISDIVPDANGHVLLNFSTTAVADWGFNAGILIEEYTDAGGGTVTAAMLDTEEPAASAVTTDSMKVMVYPNPFTDQVKIDFLNSSASNKITAEVYDLYGRLLYRQNYMNRPAGANTLNLEAKKSFAGEGIHIIALKINGKLVRAVKLMRKRS